MTRIIFSNGNKNWWGISGFAPNDKGSLLSNLNRKAKIGWGWEVPWTQALVPTELFRGIADQEHSSVHHCLQDEDLRTPEEKNTHLRSMLPAQWRGGCPGRRWVHPGCVTSCAAEECPQSANPTLQRVPWCPRTPRPNRTKMFPTHLTFWDHTRCTRACLFHKLTSTALAHGA